MQPLKTLIDRVNALKDRKNKIKKTSKHDGERLQPLQRRRRQRKGHQLKVSSMKEGQLKVSSMKEGQLKVSSMKEGQLKISSMKEGELKVSSMKEGEVYQNPPPSKATQR